MDESNESLGSRLSRNTRAGRGDARIYTHNTGPVSRAGHTQTCTYALFSLSCLTRTGHRLPTDARRRRRRVCGVQKEVFVARASDGGRRGMEVRRSAERGRAPSYDHNQSRSQHFLAEPGKRPPSPRLAFLELPTAARAAMSALFDQQNPYGAPQQHSNYGYGPGSNAAGASGSGSGAARGQAGGGAGGGLSFYSGGSSGGTLGMGYGDGNMYGGSSAGIGGVGGATSGRSSLEGNMSGFSGNAADRAIINSQMSFWSAFGTGGFPDEPSLMEGEYAARLGGWIRIRLPEPSCARAHVVFPSFSLRLNRARDQHPTHL